MRKSLQQPITMVFEAMRGTPYTGMSTGKANPRQATPPAYPVTWTPLICSTWLGSALLCSALLYPALPCFTLLSALSFPLFGSDPTGIHVAASQNRDAIQPMIHRMVSCFQRGRMTICQWNLHCATITCTNLVERADLRHHWATV